MMEALILAGGLGTRLRGVVKDVPKPMAIINGHPFLYYIFRWLKNYPVSKVIVSAGYRSSSIIEYFGSSFMDIPVVYAIEEKPLGTGGAIMFSLLEASLDNVLVINGDTFFPVNIDRLVAHHAENHASLTIALKMMNDFSRYGSVDCVDDTIVRFNEKSFCREGYINGGIYVIRRDYFDGRQLPASFSFEKEILEKEAMTSSLKCMIFEDTFIDIGIPEDLARASTILIP